MEINQLLFTVTLTITTLFLIIVGIQLIFILNDLRKMVKKLNRIIESFEQIGGSFENGVAEIFGFLKGIKSLFKVIDFLHKKKNGKEK